jgi:lysozyme
MIPSQKCIDFIKKREQLVLRSYRDIASVVTIGYGTTMMDGKPVQMGQVITEAQAEHYLAVEMTEKSKAVVAALKGHTVTQGNFDALTSFAYNAGIGALQESTLLKKVLVNPADKTMIPKSGVTNVAVLDFMNKNNLSEINTIHHEFMKWVYVLDPKSKQKVISKGLQVRRNLEYQLYCS